jgi:O-antigen ligase
MTAFMHRFSSGSLACLLLLCFPLLGNTIRSWTGLFFVFLLVLALVSRPWRQVSLDSLERRNLLLFVLMFLAIVVSGLANGWTDNQTRGFGVYVRYVAFVPIYFLLRSTAQGLQAFAIGCAFAAVLLVGQGLYDVLWLEKARAYGVYDSPGLFAGQAVVFGLASVLLRHESRPDSWQRLLANVGLACAVVAVGLSGSRSTFVALSLLALSVLVWRWPLRKRASLALAVAASAGLLYASLPMVKEQVNRGAEEIEVYFSYDNPVLVPEHGSVGQRLEMWRAAAMVIVDHPLLGVGWRGFGSAAQTYVDQGRAHPSSVFHPHPHNTYLEFFVSAGVLGFGLLMAWGWLVTRQIAQHRAFRPFTAKVAGLFTLFLALAAINEGGLFIYGNSLSFYLMACGFFMAALRKPLNS